MFRHLTFPTLSLLIAPALAIEPLNHGTLTLVDEPGFNQLDVGLTVQDAGSASDTSTITGTVDVRLAIDPATARSPELTFLGGSLQGTPIRLRITRFIFITIVDVSSSTLGGTVLTTAPPGLSDPITGLGDAAQHEFQINQGTVTGTAQNPLTNERTDINMDFSAAPVAGEGSGNTTLTLIPAGTTPTRSLFDVVVTYPVDLTSPVENDLGVTATLTATGTIKAAGQISAPLPYPDWAVAQGIPGAPPEGDANRDGIQNGIVWALGLSHADDPRPHLLMPNPAVPKGFMLQLPATGNSGAITVEASADLSPGSWLPLSPADLSAGANPLPPGTTGNVMINPPAGTRHFLRLMTNP